MIKKIFNLYRTPLFLSLTIAIALIATNLIKSPLDICYILVGSLAGTFLLDIDYLIYAYITEPTSDLSKHLRAFISHKDIGNALNHIYYNKNEVKEQSLNSALFQIALATLAIFTTSSLSGVFIKSLILATYANSIYRLSEHYFKGTLDDWFWVLKETPKKQSVGFYTFGLLAILIYSILLF